MHPRRSARNWRSWAAELLPWSLPADPDRGQPDLRTGRCGAVAHRPRGTPDNRRHDPVALGTDLHHGRKLHEAAFVSPICWRRPGLIESCSSRSVFVIAYQFVEPAPPRTLTISTGGEAGRTMLSLKRYAAILERSGVRLDIKTSAGSLENLARLNKGEVDVAFCAGRRPAGRGRGGRTGTCSRWAACTTSRSGFSIAAAGPTDRLGRTGRQAHRRRCRGQ